MWNPLAIRKAAGEWSGKSVTCAPCPSAGTTWADRDPSEGGEGGYEVAASPPPASAKASAIKSLNEGGFDFASSPPPASATYNAIKSLIDPAAAAAADLAKAKQQAVTRAAPAAAPASAIRGPWVSVEGTSVAQVADKLDSVRDADGREVG